jgi:hypothetical protein
MISMNMDTSKVEALLKANADLDEKLKQQGYLYFKSHTPIRTGNARRNTFRADDEIVADYPYAQRLDEGYSRQAPRGMTEPTIEYMEQLFEQLIKEE